MRPLTLLTHPINTPTNTPDQCMVFASMTPNGVPIKYPRIPTKLAATARRLSPPPPCLSSIRPRLLAVLSDGWVNSLRE